MARHPDPHTKIELLRAAEAIFAEKGLASAKVEDITALAGVSKGAFYLHFDGKEACFREIVEVFLSRLATCIGDGEKKHREGLSVTEMLAEQEAHDLQILDFCWQNRTTLCLILNGGGGTSYAYLLDEFAERAAKSAQTWIELGCQRGLYRADLQPALVTTLMAGAYDRLVRELVKHPKRPDLEAWARQSVMVFTRGMLTAQARNIADRRVSKPASTVRAAPRATSPKPPRRRPRIA